MWWGLEPILLMNVFWRHIFLNNKAECVRLSEILVLFTLQFVFPFLCDCFFQCYTPFCFLRIWNIVLNGWNSYYLCSDHCLRYSMNVSAKVDIELIPWCFVLMDCSLSLLPHLKLNERLWLNGYLAFDKISRVCLCDIFMYMWLHFPMVMCIVSTNLYNFWVLIYIWPS